MADLVIVERQELLNVANSIRNKTGNTDTMKVSEMPLEIGGIYTEPVLQEKTITENGEVVADDGYDGLSKVSVNVEGKNKCNFSKFVYISTLSLKENELLKDNLIIE